jgi:hypothetical protein
MILEFLRNYSDGMIYVFENVILKCFQTSFKNMTKQLF